MESDEITEFARNFNHKLICVDHGRLVISERKKKKQANFMKLLRKTRPRIFCLKRLEETICMSTYRALHVMRTIMLSNRVMKVIIDWNKLQKLLLKSVKENEKAFLQIIVVKLKKKLTEITWWWKYHAHSSVIRNGSNHTHIESGQHLEAILFFSFVPL